MEILCFGKELFICEINVRQIYVNAYMLKSWQCNCLEFQIIQSSSQSDNNTSSLSVKSLGQHAEGLDNEWGQWVNQHSQEQINKRHKISEGISHWLSPRKWPHRDKRGGGKLDTRNKPSQFRIITDKDCGCLFSEADHVAEHPLMQALNTTMQTAIWTGWSRTKMIFYGPDFWFEWSIAKKGDVKQGERRKAEERADCLPGDERRHWRGISNHRDSRAHGQTIPLGTAWKKKNIMASKQQQIQAILFHTASQRGLLDWKPLAQFIIIFVKRTKECSCYTQPHNTNVQK